MWVMEELKGGADAISTMVDCDKHYHRIAVSNQDSQQYKGLQLEEKQKAYLSCKGKSDKVISTCTCTYQTIQALCLHFAFVV